MATNVQIGVRLIPVGEPWVKVKAPGIDEYIQLTSPINLTANFATEFAHETLTIEHLHKSDTDAITAVIVDSISFFGITDSKFAQLGVYTPEYPEPWASQQLDLLPIEISGQTYLGWNGTYRLQFGVPVFTWMHQVQNLGWIYQ